MALYFAQINRKFFIEFFMSAEVYFRSPFGHLPVTFAQTRDSSSLIFSANLEPFRARLRGLEAEKAVFSPPPVYSVKPTSDVEYCAQRRQSIYCDISHAKSCVMGRFASRYTTHVETERIDRYDRQTDRMDRYIDRYIEWIDGKNGQMDRQMDRQNGQIRQIRQI